MIRIHRPSAEPPALAAARAVRLPEARAAFAAGKAISCEGYGVAKPALAAMQYRKCCYCESLQEDESYRDVEHYRPKEAYWWLAWTWENLLFSCERCNRSHKRKQFPLTPGDVALVPEQSPPGAEHPLVIDPSDPSVDPMDEIEFKPVKIQGRQEWMPFGKTPRGHKTIEVCGLQRPGLLGMYRRHVNDYVRPRIEPVIEAHRREEKRVVVAAWTRATRALLGPAAPFRGLSHDALHVLVPANVRQRYLLTLTRP